MEKQFPSDIHECFRNGANRLGVALEKLEWPSGGKNSPPPEINALINVGHFLKGLPEPFDIYAEGSCANGRIDAMGFNEKIAFALEAKNFGPINARAEAAYKDLERMTDFFPAMTQKLTGALRPREWWKEADERWGIILISSFRGQAIADAWTSEAESGFMKNMNRYKSEKDRPQLAEDGSASGFLRLYRQFSANNRGAALITTGERWRGCGQGWFLWGAIPL